MARTKSQKAKRLSAKMQRNQARAAATREAIQRERIQQVSYAPATYLQAIQQGAESKQAQRVKVHHKRVTYHALDDDKLHAHTRREVMPLVRIATTTRQDSKAKISARVLQTYHRLAKQQGINKRDMLEWFKTERPHDAQILKLI